MDQLCFPEGGVASVHEIMSDGSRVGIGILGREGFVGWQVLLSCEVSPHETMIAIAGPSALWIDAAALLEATERSSSLKALLLRFIQAFLSQMSRTIVSNLGDSTERRLSRWLLMNHDRIEGDCIDLTHSQIGVMLGVRRATVTDTLHILEGEALIRSTRGRIAVRDREGLKRLAGESYGIPEEQYRRLVAPFGREDG